LGTDGFDISNQLVRVLNNTNQVAEYTYNGAGQRIKKVTQTETRIFHYDLRGHLIAETDQSGQMLAEYVYLGDQLLSMIKPGEAVYYYHNDHLGTPQVLTDDSQAIAWKAVYTPFGEAVASIQTVENPFRFSGQYYDPETGLHYNYFRYYNPQTGRYITPDPIGLEGGINLFAYTANNPINFRDSSGLAAFYWHWIISFAAGLAEGRGWGQSSQIAWESMWRDWGTQGPNYSDTNIHGMVGWDEVLRKYQTPDEAIMNAKKIVQDEAKCGRHGNAMHTVQDLEFFWHAGQKWEGNNPLKNPLAIPHWSLDINPPVWELWNAFQASRQYLRQQGR
jgi:RHS repeat-associated protein